MQLVGSSRDSSLPLPEGNEGPVVGNHAVAGVEVSSSQALTTGSNLGAHPHESSRAVDLFLDFVLALSIAMAHVISVAIAATPDGTVALVLNIATVLTKAIDPDGFC